MDDPSERRALRDQNTTSHLNDAECVSALESIISRSPTNFDGIGDLVLKAMPAYLYEYSEQCAKMKKFEEAQVASDLILPTKAELRRRFEISVRNGSEAKDEKQEPENFPQIFQMFDQDTKHRHQSIEERQKKVLANFDKIWSQKKILKYRKPSAKILTLKSIVSSLVSCAEYSTARQVQKEVDDLELEAVNLAQKSLDNDYSAAKARLIETQRIEEEKYIEKRAYQRQVIERIESQQKELLEKRGAVIRIKEIQSHIKGVTLRDKEAGAVQVGLPRRPQNDGGPFLLPPLLPPVESRSQPKRQSSRSMLSNHKFPCGTAFCPPIWGFGVDASNPIFSMTAEKVKAVRASTAIKKRRKFEQNSEISPIAKDKEDEEERITISGQTFSQSHLIDEFQRSQSPKIDAEPKIIIKEEKIQSLAPIPLSDKVDIPKVLPSGASESKKAEGEKADCGNAAMAEAADGKGAEQKCEGEAPKAQQ